MKDNFLKNMFNDLNDISGKTDEEVTADLEAMGVDVEGAKKRFEETIKKCRAKATFNIRLDDEQLKLITEKMDRLEASENSARVRLSYVEAELEALKCCGNCAGWDNEKLIDGCDQLVTWKQSWDRCDRWEKRK